MVKLFLDKKERDTLCALFESIDEDRDGRLTLQEIIKGYNEKYGIPVTEADLHRVQRTIDVNKEGLISITEFLLGTCNKQNVMTDTNLKLVYNIIDVN